MTDKYDRPMFGLLNKLGLIDTARIIYADQLAKIYNATGYRAYSRIIRKTDD